MRPLATLVLAFWLLGGLLLTLQPAHPLPGQLGPIALPTLGRWWRVALVALVYSVAIELVQLAVPDRSADIDDVIVNVAGALIGYLLLVAVRGLARMTIGPRRT